MRALIAVGCNKYEHETTLVGAEHDATRIFDSLLRQDVGDYDSPCSTLLLSPTLEEVRASLRKILPLGNIDTFTFYFAGHGIVHAGSFYMCVRDTTSQALSLTAFSLSELFRSLTDFAPTQSNIIIDACKSGGLIADLSAVLKPEVLGNDGTPGITLVATSAQDQDAGETELGGMGTNALLDCIEGRTTVNDQRPALDLAEIGRHMHSLMQGCGEQKPVVWGLNLFGSPGFCRNPRYGFDPAKRLRDVLQAWPSEGYEVLRENYSVLWEAYSSIDSEWLPRDFARIIEHILPPLSTRPEALASFIERLVTASLDKAEISSDAFRPAEVSASLAVCLLPFAGSQVVRDEMNRLLVRSGDYVRLAMESLIVDLRADYHALLSRHNGGIADLYVLPLRITKILAWAGISGLLLDNVVQQEKANQHFRELVGLILHHYTLSLTLMTDAQAPYVAVIITCAHKLGLGVECEQIFGLLYSAYLSCHGNLASCDIPDDRVLEYLESRACNDYSGITEHVERPGQALTVLLKSSELLGLQDVANDDLWELDRTSFLAYIPPSFAEFGLEQMAGGGNFVWSVGMDVFVVNDLIKSWPTVPPPRSELEAKTAIAASLLYPDRVAWFLLS